MSKRALGEETGETSASKRLKRVETRSEEESVASADGLTQLMPSNVDEGQADFGHYQATVLPHITANHSVINCVQGDQINTTNIFHESSDKREKIRQWLSPTIPSTSYDEALELRLQDTGMWFIQDKRFLDWKEKADSLLWLYGKPGCGKTILSSSIIEDISHRCDGSQAIAYGYFFFDGRDSQKGLQRLEHLVISLIWQFSGRYQTFPKALEGLYDSCSSGAQRPSMDSLHRTLLFILNGFHHAYLIVDALDECTERNKLLKWIDEVARWKVGKLHVLATSRQELDIQKALRSLNPILIGLEGECVEHDIKSYLDWMLQDDKKGKGWDHDTRYKVKTSLLQGAQGMFRWVALQLDELGRCRSRRQVEQQLGRLPKDLYESYDRIICRIDERDREDAMTLFQWLAFSIRPLELSELAEVVAVDFDSRDLPWFDHHRRYDDVEGILEVCSGFVSITDGKVKLAHFSVKEYLLSQSTSSFHLTETNSHLHISKTCLAYLAQFDKPDSWINSRPHEYPLARYAAVNWVTHAKSGDFDSMVDHQNLAINMFHNRHILVNWVQMWNIDRPWNPSPPNKIHPLYYASRAGLGMVVRALVKIGVDVNAKGGWYGNALHVASSIGHEEIVKILLENGADVNAQGGEYSNALLEASSKGYDLVVKILLENGADVHARGGVYSSALFAASSKGYKLVVKILLENGADVNARDGGHGNALLVASLNGHEAVVKTLLKNGADVNAQGGRFGNALQAASSTGHEAIVKMLIENGADVNTQGGEYRNALYAASSNGHEAIVKILLKNGVDVNTQGGCYGNALIAASSNGHEAVVKILLKNGADVNAQGGWRGNALLVARSNGHDEIVKILLENGAYAWVTL